MIDQETKQRILEATQIEEVIGEFVSLKKRGANHIGCCPFHNEKTPSFYVSPAKGIFKCFGCGVSGDAVSFLMQHEHYTYPEALKYLAKKYNIEVVDEVQTEEQKAHEAERDSLFHASEFAQKYFADLLYNSEQGRSIGLSYFHERGMSDEIIKRFGLGYCIDEWSNFTDWAMKNGYSEQVLEKTGLTIVKEDGKRYDRFRGRVAFPIFSITGRVLGFSCRTLKTDKNVAKYVNSPDSDIYNKSHILYGLFQAKKAILQMKKCYLVEGNVDVVSMHQSGVENTVASCGTSLTIEQVRLLKRFTKDVTIVYDGDSAGIKATQRAASLMFQEGIRVRCVLFPDGDDPDSYAQRNGSAKLQQYLSDNEENFIMYKARCTQKDILHDPIRKSEFLQDMVHIIADVPDLIERTEYITQCSSLFGIQEQVLTSSVAKAMAVKKQEEWKKEHKSTSDSEKISQTDGRQDVDDQQEIAPVAPVAPHQPDYVANPMEPYERNLVQLLLQHGGDYVRTTITVVDENNPEEAQVHEVSMSVASAIVSTLDTAGIMLETPIYRKLVDLYRIYLDRKELPSANTFVACEDIEVRNTALTLLMQPYDLSPIWREKGIEVPAEKVRVQSDVMQSLLLYRKKRIEYAMELNAKQLQRETDSDVVMTLLQRHADLLKERNKIGEELHIVIS